jgi:ligand-binding sensor domain-containing protein
MPNDALVRLSPQTGATLQVVELSMSETATAFTIDARGEFLVTGGSEGVFTVDISTGKTQRARRNTGVMLTGIVPGR